MPFNATTYMDHTYAYSYQGAVRALKRGGLSLAECDAILPEVMKGVYLNIEPEIISEIIKYFYECISRLPEARRFSFYKSHVASHQQHPVPAISLTGFDIVLMSYLPECDHEPYMKLKCGSVQAFLKFFDRRSQSFSSMRYLRGDYNSGYKNQLPDYRNFLIAKMINVFYWASSYSGKLTNDSSPWSCAQDLRNLPSLDLIWQRLLTLTKSQLIKPMHNLFSGEAITLSKILNQFCPKGTTTADIVEVLAQHPDCWLSQELRNPDRFSLTIAEMTGVDFLNIFLGHIISSQNCKLVSASSWLVLGLFNSQLINEGRHQRRVGHYLSLSQLLLTPIFKCVMINKLLSIPVEDYLKVARPMTIARCIFKHFGEVLLFEGLSPNEPLISVIMTFIKPGDKAGFQAFYHALLKVSNGLTYLSVDERRKTKASNYLRVFNVLPATHQSPFLMIEVNDSRRLQDVIADNYPYTSLYKQLSKVGDPLLSQVKKLVSHYQETGETNGALVRLLAGFSRAIKAGEVIQALEKFFENEKKIEEAKVDEEVEAPRAFKYR